MPRPNVNKHELQRKTHRVLIVEDDDTISALTKEIVEQCGCVAETADTGSLGLELYSENPRGYSFVILDLGLPGMSGEELLQGIRELNPSARVVVSSGYADRLDAHDMSRLGVVAILPKPYGARQMKELIEALIC